ncbi:MAG: type III polyketide synthase [Propionibacteriaceae bacterium]
MTQILAVHGTLPDHVYPQAMITSAFADLVGAGAVDARLLARLHANTGVSSRHLALPLERYAELGDFGATNDAFISAATTLGTEAVAGGLRAADLTPGDVDVIISATVTGLAVPSLDARMAPRLGLREDVRRLPLVGLGCVAGAAGLARVHDYLLGRPDGVAVLVATEICSLTLQSDDASIPNLIASGLFGDGAAAVVAVGPDHPSASLERAPGSEPRVLSTRSRLYPDTERAMGWDVGASGLRLVLGAEIPDLVHRHVGSDVDTFLADSGLHRQDIAWWVCHPGGPKVLEALQGALDLERADLAVTWDSLDRVGNLSSASVLHVLADTLATRPPEPGTYGLMMAMGPGFCLELVLLQA